MLAYDQITWLHVENTSKCNAHCPACARNNSGYGLKENLTIEDLDFNKFLMVLELLPNLKTLQLCGTYGDPIAGANIDVIIDKAIEKNLEIRIHTNGSLKTTNWWDELGLKLSNHSHCIIFGIDGLESIHEIYRQGTSFKKIINNAKSFIDAGGIAEWQFLLFEHNQHQAKDCMKLSQSLGFKKFTAKKSIRIPNPAYHFQTGQPFEIKPFNTFLEKFNNQAKTVTKENCMHLNLPSAYLNASGLLTPCCYLNDLTYHENIIDQEILNNNASERCKLFCGKNTVAHIN